MILYQETNTDDIYLNEFHCKWNEACMRTNGKLLSGSPYSSGFMRAQSMRMNALVDAEEERLRKTGTMSKNVSVYYKPQKQIKKFGTQNIERDAPGQNGTEHKESASKIYNIIKSHDFNSVNIRLIDKYISEAVSGNWNGQYLSARIPQEVGQYLYANKRKNIILETLFSRIFESIVSENVRLTEDGKRSIEEGKKDALKAWAEAADKWYSEILTFTDDSVPIGSGTDSDVYSSKDGYYVIKASKGKPYGKRFRPDIDQIALFNYIFPNTAYDILGYGEIKGQFVKILKQPFVDFSRTVPLVPEERENFMHSLGFVPMNNALTAFSNGVIIVSDLQKSNIVKDMDGNIRVIDADMKLHTKDVGGNYTYPPVENDITAE